jgi:hypothetical protein
MAENPYRGKAAAERRLADVIERLNNLLGVDRPVGPKFSGLPVPRLLAVATRAIANQDWADFTGALVILGKLVQDLERVRDYDTSLFHHFLKRLRTEDRQQYLGTRFELGTASAFIGNAIDFSRPEETGAESVPDFLVPAETGMVLIECTVPRIQTTSRKDLPYKIHAAVSEKAKKDLAREDLVVFVDATILEGTAYRDDLVPPMHSVFLPSDLQNQVDKLGLGGVVVCVQSLRRANAKTALERKTLSIVGSSSSEAAREFLSRHYPSGEGEPYSPTVPAAY